MREEMPLPSKQTESESDASDTDVYVTYTWVPKFSMHQIIKTGANSPFWPEAVIGCLGNPRRFKK